jgi:hypothetical protein
MDSQVVRQRLREAYADLEKIEERREALTAIVRGYEALVRLDGPPEPEPAPALPLPTPGPAKGTVSFRAAVQQVLREARGQPLHIKEIYARATALGAVSGAKEPVRVTDLMIYSLRTRTKLPIEKVAAATYRWAGPTEASG